MSVHADVAIPARDRRRLERLCRYVARPPLALERLEELGDGRLAYRLKTPWRDGTTHVVMERTELLERLAPLVPPPRAHQVRYHGLLAPCASGRDRMAPVRVERSQEQVTLRGGPTADVGGVDSALDRMNGSSDSSRVGHLAVLGIESRNEPSPGKSNEASRLSSSVTAETHRAEMEAPPPQASASASTYSRRDSRRSFWADLLQRVFEVDALRCPNCGARMRVLSAITDPDVARRILDCLQIPSSAPPVVPPQYRAGADLEEGFADLDWGGDPGFDFDQSDPTAG